METMNLPDIIAKKQEGFELNRAEIESVIREYSQGAVPDYQMAALLTTIYFRGMTKQETVDLVEAMIASGKKADLSHIGVRKVDKHSTGGVGDKISLLVAPIVASLGIPVPMISGRGLGHTGGTLDKLESIPGFTTAMTVKEFERQVTEIGCALIGQSEEFVPADQKMYALRDATSTVKSIPLVTASILSKKVAEGIDALLLDVKVGRGALFPDIRQARELAGHLVNIGEELGLEVFAMLTDMSQPLGKAVGNWLEVRECIQILKGGGNAPDLVELSLAQAAVMQVLAGTAPDYKTGKHRAENALESGAAYSKFLEIAGRQKADVSYIENPSKYPSNSFERTVSAQKSGYIQIVDALDIGKSAVQLGAGRLQKEDSIDYSAGIILRKKAGEKVKCGEELATLYASDEEKLESVRASVQEAFKIGQEPPPPKNLILAEITIQGERPWTN